MKNNSIFNGYGNPYFREGGGQTRALRSTYSYLADMIESRILVLGIPMLDKVDVDTVVQAVSYLASSAGGEKFSEYFVERARIEIIEDQQMAWRMVFCKRFQRRLDQEIFDGFYTYLEDQPYENAVAIVAYFMSNIPVVFASYILNRQMLKKATETGNKKLAESARNKLANQRNRVGLASSNEMDKLISDVAEFDAAMSPLERDQLERDMGLVPGYEGE